MEEQQVQILYTNHRGETKPRNIIPQSLHFGTSQWHRKPQWILNARDLDKDADRSFAMVDVQSWTAT